MSKPVFISYSTDDTASAEQMRDGLEAGDGDVASIACWMAPRDIAPGKEYAEQILDAIEGCAVLVLLVSETSNVSRFVRNEVERAVSKDKVIIPVRIHEVTLSRSLEFFISSAQWIDALQGVEAVIPALTAALRQYVPAPPAAETGKEAAAARPRNLPNPATPFVGRSQEIEQILSQLQEPGCRLLTLLGQGGMGKTRLSIEIASHFYADADAVPDGVFFAALENLSRPEQIPGAIASSLGLPATSADPQRLLLYHLADKRLLLVLDNFEHLLEGAGLIAEILAAAPQVKILVTSREKLNLQEEWLFPVGGLDLPDVPIDPVAQAQASGAVQLFLQGARRVQAGRDFTADLPCIVELCQLVAGAPLALELAAQWLRLLSCAQIVAQLQESLDLLATPLRNVPERHRSMRAVFDYSWQLADQKARGILCQLAVFAGGFDWPAFQSVVRGSVMELATLVDASWVQVSQGERYSLHPLVRSYLQEKLAQEYPALAGEEMQAVPHRHSQHYSQVASGASTTILLREINNLVAGWRHAIQRLDVESLRRYVEPMAGGGGMQWPMSLGQTDALLSESVERLRQQRGKGTATTAGVGSALLEAILLTARINLIRRAGRLVEADKLAAEALTQLEVAGDGNESSRLRVQVLIALANVQGAMGRLEESGMLLDKLAVSTTHPMQRAVILSFKGGRANSLGDYEIAAELELSALPIFEQFKPGMFACRLGLSFTAVQRGEAEVALQHLQQAKVIFEDAGPVQQLDFSIYQARYELLIGNGDAAYALCLRALPEFRAYGYALSLVSALVVHGKTCLVSDKLDEAERAFREAHELAAEMQTVSANAMAMLGLAACALRREHPQDGEAYARQALALVWPCGLLPLALDSVVNLAETRILSGNSEKARVWLRVVMAHPATAYLVRVRARKLLESIGAESSEVEFSDPKLALDEIVTGLLAENRKESVENTQ